MVEMSGEALIEPGGRTTEGARAEGGCAAAAPAVVAAESELADAPESCPWLTGVSPCSSLNGVEPTLAPSSAAAAAAVKACMCCECCNAPAKGTAAGADSKGASPTLSSAAEEEWLESVAAAVAADLGASTLAAIPS